MNRRNNLFSLPIQRNRRGKSLQERETIIKNTNES